ncbi:MAG: hypothetical protein K6F55_07440 [Eubacterium sp.]|nr:hypothetical protein [Eubacterium sp.]
MYRMFGIDYYDSILLSGDFQVKQVRELEKKWGLPEKELEIVGLPHMDDMKKRVFSGSAESTAGHQRTVLSYIPVTPH